VGQVGSLLWWEKLPGNTSTTTPSLKNLPKPQISLEGVVVVRKNGKVTTTAGARSATHSRASTF
jgi:hypothetical protein